MLFIESRSFISIDTMSKKFSNEFIAFTLHKQKTILNKKYDRVPTLS